MPKVSGLVGVEGPKHAASQGDSLSVRNVLPPPTWSGGGFWVGRRWTENLDWISKILKYTSSLINNICKVFFLLLIIIPIWNG